MSVRTSPRTGRVVPDRTARELSVPFPKFPIRLTTHRPVVPTSFLSGIASAMQLMPTVPGYAPAIPHRDLLALQRNLRRVQEDLRRAMEQFAARMPADLPKQERLFSVEDYDNLAS